MSALRVACCSFCLLLLLLLLLHLGACASSWSTFQTAAATSFCALFSWLRYFAAAAAGRGFGWLWAMGEGDSGACAAHQSKCKWHLLPLHATQQRTKKRKRKQPRQTFATTQQQRQRHSSGASKSAKAACDFLCSQTRPRPTYAPFPSVVAAAGGRRQTAACILNSN